MNNGGLYIIPLPLSESTREAMLSGPSSIALPSLRCFAVENLKTARRFLRQLDHRFPIDDCRFFELDKHNNYEPDSDLLAVLESGVSIGLMSECGYPGVADPGHKLVSFAHQKNIRVSPFIGPSSLIMALSASGLNGQRFAFWGYPPLKNPDRSAILKKAGEEAKHNGTSVIFIETPFRNQQMLLDIISSTTAAVRLCVACDITGTAEWIATKTIGEWKKVNRQLPKLPAVFIIGK